MLRATSEEYETMLDEAKHENEHLTSSMNQNTVEYEKQIEELGLALRTTNEKYEGMLDEAKNEIDHLTSTAQQTISKADWKQRELQLVSCLKASDEEKSLLKEASEKYAAMLDDAKQEINNLKEEMQHIEKEHAWSKAEWEEKEQQLMNYLKATEEEVSSLNQEVVRLCGSLKEVKVQESSTSPVIGENQQVMETALDKAHDDSDDFERIEKEGTVVGKSDGVEFSMKDGHFCPALAKAVKTMKKGEKVLLTVKPQYGFAEKGKLASGDEGAVPQNTTLQISLELLSWKTVSHVTDDKKVIKKILKEGKGFDRPNEQAVVKVKLVGKLEDDTIFFKKGRDEKGELLEFKTDEE
ncbi:hypothetical protein Droror1_Dr00014802 [Drosera rotundifolia]